VLFSGSSPANLQIPCCEPDKTILEIFTAQLLEERLVPKRFGSATIDQNKFRPSRLG